MAQSVTGRPRWSIPFLTGKKLPPLLDGKVFIGHQPAVDLEALLKKGVRLKSMELWLQGKKQRDTILEAKLADENRGKDGYRLENLLLSDYRTDSWKIDTEAIRDQFLRYGPRIFAMSDVGLTRGPLCLRMRPR